MASLELFPNSAVYKVKTANSEIEVPIGADNAIATYRNGEKVVAASVVLIRERPFAIGDLVMVNNITGVLANIDGDTVELITKEGDKNIIARIVKPKTMVSNGLYNKKYLVAPSNVTVTLRAVMNNIRWKPTYLMVLSNNIDEILQFSLLGRIIGTNIIPFMVSSIEFNTKPLLSVESDNGNRDRGLAMAQSTTTPETARVPDEIPVSFTVNNSFKVVSEATIPLQNLELIRSQRVYFLDAEDNARATYGYRFQVNNFLPRGPVLVQDSNADTIGATELELDAETVTVKVALEENLIVKTFITAEDIRDNAAQTNAVTGRHISYRATVMSKFSQKVTLIICYRSGNNTVETNPKSSIQVPGKLLWVFLLNPTDSNEINIDIVVRY